MLASTQRQLVFTAIAVLFVPALGDETRMIFGTAFLISFSLTAQNYGRTQAARIPISSDNPYHYADLPVQGRDPIWLGRWQPDEAPRRAQQMSVKSCRGKRQV